MGLACKITGHKWNKLPDGSDGCKCTRCGERRNEGHEWNGCTCIRCGKHRNEDHRFSAKPGSCEYVCEGCGKTQIRHDGDGCTCRTCGDYRDKGHVWVLDGNAKSTREGHLMVCEKCGSTARTTHSFVKADGCRRRCVTCGYKERYHDFVNDVCRDCGVRRVVEIKRLKDSTMGSEPIEYGKIERTYLVHADGKKVLIDEQKHIDKGAWNYLYG